MPENIFVDTSGWLAIADKDDSYHKKAVEIYTALLRDNKSFLTSNFVIAESYIMILNNIGYEAAISYLDKINTSPRIIKVRSTEDIEREAEGMLKKYKGQDFSYTDSVSFSIMKQWKIKKAFCFDVHFKIAGFLTLP